MPITLKPNPFPESTLHEPVAKAPRDDRFPVLVGSEYARSPDEVVYLAVRMLAGMDEDYARERNDVGFSRIHVEFGHKLASMPFEQWSERQRWAARKMLDVYKNTQLRGLVEFMPPLQAIPPDASKDAPRERETFRRMTIGRRDGKDVAILEQGYDPELVRVVKSLPMRRWDAERKQWYVPLELEALEPLATFATEYGYDIDPAVQQRIVERAGEFKANVELSRAVDADIDVALPEGKALFPFQKAGVAYAQRVGNVLIADEMGLGKTVQALIAVAREDQFPLVVVCPASLKRNWEREANRWLPNKTVAVLGSQRHALRFMGGRPSHDIYIVNYNSRILYKWIAELIELRPKAIVFDEAHNCKNPKAQQTKLAEKLALESRARIIALSGTPVVNRPMEFWQIIKLLGKAKEMGGYAKYKARYDTTDVGRLNELNQRARSLFMVRRLKQDVLTELPPKMYNVVPLDITNRAAYDAAERNIAGYFATKKVEDAEFLRNLAFVADNMGLSAVEREGFMIRAKKERFNQAYNIAARAEQLVRWEALKDMAVRGKIDAVVEWIDDFLASGEKLVVFVNHVWVGQRIAQRYGADFIHGGVDSDARQPMVDRFQNDPTRKVIVGNMIAAGEGLTLTAASNVAFVEFGWNPKTHSQAEDRCHRIGQTDAVTVHQLIAIDTIEEELCALIDGKRAVTGAIQDGEEAVTQALMMDSLRDMLEQRLARKQLAPVPAAAD